MERRNFIKSTALGGFMLTAFSSFGKFFSGTTANNESGKYRGVEGVLSPTNTHMVCNGFKVMNFFTN